jgi:hypothetical protein
MLKTMEKLQYSYDREQEKFPNISQKDLAKRSDQISKIKVRVDAL